jgi:hypothetical protein
VDINGKHERRIQRNVRIAKIGDIMKKRNKKGNN